MKNYTVKCKDCGFEFELTTDDEEHLDELLSCPCGGEVEVVVREV